MEDGIAAARAAVLGRLWGALAREPLPGVAGRRRTGDTLTVTLDDGRELVGPAAAAQPFGSAPVGLSIGGYADPAALVAALPWGRPGTRFAAEVADSVTNLARARAAQPAPDGGAPYLTRLPSLADLEQCVVDGHPLHPLCRTRTGLSAEEVRRYAPEHRPVVELVEVRVPPDRWLTTGEPLPPRLPLHPWQAAHVLPDHPELVDSGVRIRARPLMSLRTVAPLDRPDRHLKTAVDVQMTSAVRTVSPAAVRNGPVVSRLAAELAGRVGVSVLREVSAGAVLVDGQPCRSLAVVHRCAPDPRPGEVVLPLAVLAAPSPASGRPLVTEAVAEGYRGHPEPFAADLVRLLVPPMLRLLGSGLALEAHGQNTLVGLTRGRPTRVWYRDFGGVRLSPALFDGSPLASDDPEEWRTKLAAALFGTVLAELAAVLEREYGTDPAAVWRPAARYIRELGPPELLDPTLPVKAMTAMRLAEAAQDDIWTTVPNPMAGLA